MSQSSVVQSPLAQTQMPASDESCDFCYEDKAIKEVMAPVVTTEQIPLPPVSDDGVVSWIYPESVGLKAV
jgi:hypothetical protein